MAYVRVTDDVKHAKKIIDQKMHDDIFEKAVLQATNEFPSPAQASLQLSSYEALERRMAAKNGVILDEASIQWKYNRLTQRQQQYVDEKIAASGLVIPAHTEKGIIIPLRWMLVVGILITAIGSTLIWATPKQSPRT